MCLATESFCNRAEATRGEKNPLIHLSFLARDTMCFFHVYSPVGNIRERKQTGSGRVRVSVRREGLRPTERPIQQSARPVSSVETETEADHTSREQKFTRFKPAVAVCSAAEPVCRSLCDGSRSWTHKSLSPSAPEQQTNSHSSSN